MVTIQTIENIKLGSRITFYNGIYAIIFGLFSILFYNTLMLANFRAIDSVWQVFTKYNPEISSLFFNLALAKAFLLISMGLAIMYLSSYILKKKNKSAWVMLFIIGIIFWAGLLTTEIFNKNVYTITISFIGWISFVIGMLIPISYYTQKSYEEY